MDPNLSFVIYEKGIFKRNEGIMFKMWPGYIKRMKWKTVDPNYTTFWICTWEEDNTTIASDWSNQSGKKLWLSFKKRWCID